MNRPDERCRAVQQVEADCFTETYDDALAVLLSPGGFSSADVLKGRPSTITDARRRVAVEGLPYVRTLIDNDPPDHARFRAIVDRYLHPARIRPLAPAISGFVGAALQTHRASGAMELVGALASPLPIQVISAIMGLGLTGSESVALKEWCDDWMVLQSGIASDAELDRCATSYLSLQRFMSARLGSHDPRADDLCGELARAHADGSLSAVEQVRLALGVVVAGHETTTLGIANTVVALLGDRDLWARVAAEPALRRIAVDEALRLEPPVRMLFRRATGPARVGSRDVAPGERVAVDYAAANIDPEYMGAGAERMSVDGDRRRPHLSFGRGVHACPGSLLARMEIDVVIEALAGLIGLRLAAEPRRRLGHASLAGWSRVELAWEPTR